MTLSATIWFWSLSGAADLDGKAGDESGHGHLLGAAVEDSFDLADVGAVGEEDCGVGGRIDGLERHGGAAAAVDDSLNFGLSDGEMGDAVDSTMRLMDLAVGRLFIIVTSTWSSLWQRENWALANVLAMRESFMRRLCI